MKNQLPGQLSAKEIFTMALEFPDAAAREGWLDEQCRHDAALRQKVEELLVAAGQHTGASPLDVMVDVFAPGDTLLSSDVDGLAEADTKPMPEGLERRKIGAYKLLEQIGQGGFGTVYMAEQTVPVRRKVALKILKPGMDSGEVIARFEAERQALAMMDHPNIARIYDGGTTDTGRPYFVMELVRGIPVTDYCDEARRTTDERLTLFIDICRAVQHAHQKGIIHRDLKPSNVLVTMHDDKAVVKVIDFGIAKALSQQLTDRTLFTGYQQMLGTPLYMSPEQAQMSGIDIDTRSDVYSLGVMLYELLTGTTPFDKESLSKASFDDMRRIIREQEPPRPSARITTMQAEARSTMADRRRIDQRRVSDQLRGELDWIVMKALEKDRNRRYESASAFAADVQRYLNNEQVQACPPSASYRFRKTMRKHRSGISIGLAIGVAMLVGSSLAVWQATRATRAEHEATKYFGKSLDAIDLILSKVGTKELIDVPAMSPVRYLVIQDAVGLYLDLLPSSKQNPRVILATASALRMLSDEELYLDRLAESEATIRKSLTVLSEMRPEDQIAQSALVERGTCFQSLGNILNRQEKFDDARQAFHSSLEAYNALTAGVEDKDEYLARTKMYLSQGLFQQGTYSEAQQLLTETLTVHESAFQRSTENWWGLAVNLEWLGKLAEQRAEYSEALQLAERSFEVAEQFLATVEADNAASSGGELSVESSGVKKSVLYFQALAARQIGNLYRLLQQSEKSELSYLRMFAICNTLVQTHPEVPGFLEQQRAALENLGPHIKGETQAEKRERLRKFRNLELNHSNQHIVRGRLAETVGDIDLALSDFKRAGEMEPENSDIQLTYVYCLQYKRGDLQGSLSYVEDLCLKYPKKAVYLTCAAHLDKALGNRERSLERFRKATELEPNFGEAWSELASELDEAGDLAGSAAAMERAVNCPQTTFSVWATFGERLRKLGETKRSIEAYSKAIDMAPTAWHIRKRRADLYIATKQYSPALDDLAAAIEEKPTDLSILTWLPLEVWTDCPDPAVRDRLVAVADRMVFLNSESPEALLVRAALYDAMMDFGKSDRDFQRAVEADSENARPQYLMAITQLASGRLHEYRQTSETLKESAMQNPLPMNLYLAGWTAALIDGSLSDLTPLLNASMEGLKTTPKDVRLQLAIGSLQFRAGQYNAAEQTLSALRDQKTTDILPVYVSIFLAMTHAKQGQTDKAKEMLGIATQQAEASKAQSSFELRPRRFAVKLLMNEATTLLDSPAQGQRPQ